VLTVHTLAALNELICGARWPHGGTQTRRSPHHSPIQSTGCARMAESTSGEGKPTRVRFSTDDLPPDQRFAMWSEGIVHRSMEMEFIDRAPEGGLRFAIEFIPLGAVSAGIIQGTPSVFIRKPVDTNDGRFLVINRQGGFRAVQQGQQCDLAIGDAVMFDNRRGSEFHCLEEGMTWSLSMRRESLRHLLPDGDAIIERYIPASSQSLRLLAGYLETLFALDDIADPELAGVHIIDLIASALGARQDAQEVIDGRGVRAARLRQVLDAIAQGAGDPNLDPAAVADRLGLSVRYVHRLFEESGKTFSEHVLDRRLERAHRLLRDPRFAHQKISDVALEAGFSDISHFNRSFRQRFGDTPSVVRSDASRKDNN
jgi:AraC-like DNA-binding protein